MIPDNQIQLPGDFMSHDDMSPLRDWREIADLTAKEEDPQKVLDLAKELIRLLDEESNKRFDEVSENVKAREKGAA